MAWFGNGSDRLGWTDAALEHTWPGFELCFECMGSQLCPTCQGAGYQGEADARRRCSYCFGSRWCPVCGGAGQWPLDPSIPYFAPRAPCIDLEKRAGDRGVQTTRPTGEFWVRMSDGFAHETDCGPFPTAEAAVDAAERRGWISGDGISVDVVRCRPGEPDQHVTRLGNPSTGQDEE